METWLKRATVTAATVGLLAVPGLAEAQQGNASFGVYGSYLRSGELGENSEIGNDGFGIDNTFAYGGSVELWGGASRWIGLRGDVSYSNFTEFYPKEFFNEGPENQVNLLHFDGSLMLRPFGVDDGDRFVPFVSAGFGAVHWDLMGDLQREDPEVPGVVLRDDEMEMAWTAGLGFDAFLNDNFALRFEAKNYHYLDNPYQGLSDDGGNNLQGRVGLQYFFGNPRGTEQPGFIQEEPAPDTVVIYEEVEIDADVEPATEVVSMCVVSDAGALEMVGVTRYIGENRMVVMQNGGELAFSTAYPATSPLYVRGASWYMNDQPLVVDADGWTWDLVRFGPTSTISANNLAYVGMVDGTPVYAERSAVLPWMSELNMELRTRDDLAVILAENEELRAGFQELNTLYVAVEPGCVFQPLSLSTNVRRTRG